MDDFPDAFTEEVFRQAPPHRLYRYKSVQTEQGLARLREMVMDSMFYWSSPLEFNDPFDCIPLTPVPPSRLARERALQRLRARQRKKMGRMMADSQHRQVAKIGREALQERLDEVMLDTISSMGVLCFSEQNDNVLLWGHYGDCHRGVCLEFDPNIAEIEPSNLLYRVTYQLERPSIPRLLQDEDPGSMARALTTKAEFWEYEREWRAIDEGSAGKSRPYSPEMLTGIVFGARIDPERERVIRGWCADRRPRITLSRAIISKSDFALRIEPT